MFVLNFYCINRKEETAEASTLTSDTFATLCHLITFTSTENVSPNIQTHFYKSMTLRSLNCVFFLYSRVYNKENVFKLCTMVINSLNSIWILRLEAFPCKIKTSIAFYICS